MNAIKLIALDIDGTLTNDQKDITPRTKKALLQAQKQGIRLALVSARPANGLCKPAGLLEMEQYEGMLIAYNGGRITNAETQESYVGASIERNLAKNILRFLENLPVHVILDDGKQFFVVDRYAYKVEYECMNNQMECTEVENLADFLCFEPLKMLLSVDPEMIIEVQEKIEKFLPQSLTVVRTAEFYLEIIPRSINKGQALLDVCKVLGIDPKETIAFGDAQNDIPMLQAAGIGVAMGNAEESVKQAADDVTLSNNEDGIVVSLQKYQILT